MDVRKYFDSIDQRVLLALLARKFKDAAVLDVFEQIIASYETAPGRGLPIGNLTSQHFANFYLAPLDRFIKERLSRCAYVRYMDDFMVWGESGAELRAVWREVEAFMTAELRLTLKPNVAVNKTAFGMDFLGYSIFPLELRLARRSKLRFALKFRLYEQAWAEGRWTEWQLQQRMEALVAFILPAHSRAWRLHVENRFGVVARRLEPRDPRGQLEQQRDQLPVGESQQQQPGQQEQQHWFPRCPGPSSTGTSEDVPADPAAILSARLRASRQRAANEGPVRVAERSSAKAPGLSPPARCPCEAIKANNVFEQHRNDRGRDGSSRFKVPSRWSWGIRILIWMCSVAADVRRLHLGKRTAESRKRNKSEPSYVGCYEGVEPVVSGDSVRGTAGKGSRPTIHG